MSALSSEPAATVEVAMEFKLQLPSENHCQTQWINGSYVREGCAVEKTAARCEGIHIAPESVCEFKWKPFAEQPGAKAEYCPDTVTYNNAYNFSGLGHKVCSNLLITPPVSGEVKIGKCTQDFEDGRWHVHRVGPFTTTGGFSWTQLDFWDVGDFEALLKERPWLSVARVFNGPVDATLGQRMKLHEHHTHLNWGYQQYPSPEFSIPHCLLGEWDCFNLSPGIFQHHPISPDECASRDLRPHYIPFTQPAYFHSNENDVRAADSPPWTWFYDVRMFIPNRIPLEGSPYSFHMFQNPWKANVAAYTTYEIPYAVESYMYYTWNHPHDGAIMQILHASHGGFKRQMLFDGSPEKLGFNILLPAISNANTALVTKAAGYTNDELWDYVYAQHKGDIICMTHPPGYPDIPYRNPHAWGWRGFGNPIQCTSKVGRMVKGHQWTSIHFHVGSSEETRYDAETSGGRMHGSFVVHFVADDGKLYDHFGIGSQVSGAMEPVLTRLEFQYIYVNSHSSVTIKTTSEIIQVYQTLFYFFLQVHPITLPVLVVAFLGCALMLFCKCCRPKKQQKMKELS